MDVRPISQFGYMRVASFGKELEWWEAPCGCRFAQPRGAPVPRRCDLPPVCRTSEAAEAAYRRDPLGWVKDMLGGGS